MTCPRRYRRRGGAAWLRRRAANGFARVVTPNGLIQNLAIRVTQNLSALRARMEFPGAVPIKGWFRKRGRSDE